MKNERHVKPNVRHRLKVKWSAPVCQRKLAVQMGSKSETCWDSNQPTFLIERWKMSVYLAAAPWLESIKWTRSASGESKTLESWAKTLTSTESKWCEHSLSCSMSTLLLYIYCAFTGFHNLKKLGYSQNLSHHHKSPRGPRAHFLWTPRTSLAALLCVCFC